MDVLDGYGTKLLTAYGGSPRTAKDRADRAESALNNTTTGVARSLNSMSKAQIKAVLSLLNKEVLEDIYRQQEKINE